MIEITKNKMGSISVDHIVIEKMIFDALSEDNLTDVKFVRFHEANYMIDLKIKLKSNQTIKAVNDHILEVIELVSLHLSLPCQSGKIKIT